MSDVTPATCGCVYGPDGRLAHLCPQHAPAYQPHPEQHAAMVRLLQTEIDRLMAQVRSLEAERDDLRRELEHIRRRALENLAAAQADHDALRDACRAKNTANEDLCRLLQQHQEWLRTERENAQRLETAHRLLGGQLDDLRAEVRRRDEADLLRLTWGIY